MSDNNHNLRFLEEHLKKNPESMLFARLADAYLKEQKIAEAITMCEEGVKKFPYYVTGHLVLGKCYLANKSYDQAEKEFKRVLLFDPKYLAAHKFYGDLMQEIGWENTCESSYKKILQIDPLDEVARSRVLEFTAKNPPEPERTPEKIAVEAPEPAAPPEIDIAAISPVPISTVEDDMIFKEPAETQEPPVAPVPVVSEPEASPPAKETQPTEIDDFDSKDIEEYSGILDDIFKDEVVRESASEMPMGQDDLISEYQRTPKSFVDEFEAYRPEVERPPSIQTQPLPTPDFEDLEELDFKPQKVESRESFASPPKPEPKPQKDETPVFSTSKPKKGEKIVTPTLGEIYAAQGQYAKAIDVFELLMKKYPKNEVFPQKINILKQKLEESKNAPRN
ncbi:MAG TPA: tetratricopeptide repeat protein [bacterium]